MPRPDPYPYEYATPKCIMFGSNDPLVLRQPSCIGCLFAGSQVVLAERFLESKAKDDIIVVRCLGKTCLDDCGITTKVVTVEEAASEIDDNGYNGFSIEQLDDLYYS